VDVDDATDDGTPALTGIELSRIDLSRPSIARTYDYYLGWFHNFPVDRELAEEAITANPHARAAARSGRDFLARAVRHLVAERGVRQFLDLGSGIPTAGNVHQIAQALDPQARVVYVDVEPVAVSHGEMILAGNPHATSVLADLLEPGAVLNHPQVRDLLDLTRPTALLLSMVLHFVSDDQDPAGLLHTYREALGPDSWLVLSHVTHEVAPETVGKVAKLYDRTATPARTRTRAQILALSSDYTFEAPGIVLTEQWQPGQERPVEHPERFPIWAGVAHAR
jgi:S-adenosyl methyltransferase